MLTLCTCKPSTRPGKKMNEIYHQRQCQTCSSHFSTNGELRAHIERYRSKEAFLSSEIAKCRFHSNQLIDKYDTPCDGGKFGNDDDNCDNCDEEDDGCEAAYASKNDESPRPFYCPYKGCKRKEPFDKKKRLRRHFAIHVRCEEVCVYCFRVFTAASQYVAHAGSHGDKDKIKTSYTVQICNALRKRVDDELHSELGTSHYLSNRGESRAKKRLADVANMSTMTTGAQSTRMRSDSFSVHETIMNPVPLASFHDLIGAESRGHIPNSMQAVTALIPLPNNDEPVAMGGGSANVSEPGLALYPNSQLLNEPYEDYSAPVFWNMTFPPNHVVQHYQGASNQIHTSIRTSPPLATVDQTQSMQESNGIGLQDEATSYRGP